MLRFEYTPKKVCEDLRKFLIAISAKSVSIVGHDLGAIIGWLFAHTNPEMVDKFISVATPHPNLMWDNLPKNSPFNRRWLEFIQVNRSNLFAYSVIIPIFYILASLST